VNVELNRAIERLKPIEKQAAQWENGALMLFTGRGAEKFKVLSACVARVLQDSSPRSVGVLVFTSSSRVVQNIRSGVEALVPNLNDHLWTGSLSMFCEKVLRQHGSHIQLQRDFAVYSQDEDRRDLLSDALAAAGRKGKPVGRNDVQWLETIDQLRDRLITPERTQSHFRNEKIGNQVALIHRIYEDVLKENYAFDDNRLVLTFCSLLRQLPPLIDLYHRIYKHWIIDEFQNLSLPQYQLLRLFAGDQFQKILAVADRDQVHYKATDPSLNALQSFQQDFSPHIIHLVENRRCPNSIVRVANNLVLNNGTTPSDEESLLNSIQDQSAVNIRLREFESDLQEADAIAAFMSMQPPEQLERTAILGRNRKRLKVVLNALQRKGLEGILPICGDRLISPQFIWLRSALGLSLHPIDDQIFADLVGAGNRFAGLELDRQLIAAEASSNRGSYLEYWAHAATNTNEIGNELAQFAFRLVENRGDWSIVIDDVLQWLDQAPSRECADRTDIEEDKESWLATTKLTQKELNREPTLEEFLQNMATRRNVPLRGGALPLLTIHGAKDLEFDNVWIMGVADSILPSSQGSKNGENSLGLELERQHMISAITSTKKKLVMSYARSYDKRPTGPSCFVKEMGLNCLSSEDR